MSKRYIFHYNTTPIPDEDYAELFAHDGLECCADIVGLNVLDVVDIIFDDGFKARAFVFELEEVK